MPVHFGHIRVAEVEVVGHGQRFTTRANNVAGRFGYGDLRPRKWVGVHIAAVAIDRDHNGFIGFGNTRALHAYHGGIRRGVGAAVGRAHHRVVLLIDPPPRTDVGVAQQMPGHIAKFVGHYVGHGTDAEFSELLNIGRLGVFTAILRCATTQHKVIGGHVGHELIVTIEMQSTHAIGRGGGNLTNLGAVQIPLVENALDDAFLTLFDHHQHPLLRLREQNLERGHVGLAGGHFVEVDDHAVFTLRAHF